ncbi:HAMP domain-containing histidine kinase [Paenibacillus sp. IB182496]|uniref:histidine kinase n=1 Tax=Paenibacillus sabuli TaxID=2772509 RepID=A0A927GUJ8_9BACL|nr:HAMP domain-containing sensor histidine kinase [Paenibacillus sabuli]MBD2848431.1 HAMP domain-containing histidine kinase [Paenibacillus sabuli]
MAEQFRSFRFKMLAMFGLSMLCSGVITYSIYRVLQLYYHTLRVEDPLAQVRFWMREVGDVNFFLILFVPLSILFFLLFTRRYSSYMQELSGGIHRLASGDFNHRVAVRTEDELGGIARDLNLAAEQLKQAQERGDFAESSKERLVLNLAHDLRTPLTSVLGYLDLMLCEQDLPPQQARHYAEIAYAKSQRLEKLIDELFEITRLNYGNLPLELQRIDLGGLLLQLTEELYPVFERARLTARLQAGTPVTVWADGELLARVFENLLQNAIRYGRDGGYVDLECRSEDGEAVVSVVNYGDQIPPQELPHLFEMFFTGDKARTYRDGGTGIGLFIAKQIVERHRGTIRAMSDALRTQFEVRLPLDGAPASAGSVAGEARAERQKQLDG